MSVLAALSSPAAFAAAPWGPYGEASYEEHQALPASQYSRAEVQEAYRQASAGGWLPRTGEVVAESPAELAVAHAPMTQQAVALTLPRQTAQPLAAADADDDIGPVASTDPASTPLAGTYESPSNSDLLIDPQASHQDDVGWPPPNLPQAPLSASPDMITKSEDDPALSRI